jgi:hypothetical protein
VARDSTEYVRQAALVTLRGAATVRVLVPAERIYPGQRPPNPEWPFIAYGVPVTGDFRAAGLDGSTTTVAIHVYAETTGEDDATVGGEDAALAISRVVASVLDGAALALQGNTDCPYPATAHFTWTGTTVVQDGGDASAFHGIVSFDITVSS